MTTRVYLLSSFEDPAQDTHWASPYAALRRAFSDYRGDECALTEDPQRADLILICPRPRNPVWPTENFRHGIAWRCRAKCVVVSTDDDPTMTHKGFYTSLRTSQASPRLRGGFYPCVTYGHPAGALPAGSPRYLFSFLGSFATHPVRRDIGRLAVHEWAARGDRFLVRDTARAQNQQPIEVFQQEYIESLRQSKFVLCPRGMSPSSLRLFEAMKAARVPVIISDEWVPPHGIDWERFAIRLSERDLVRLPDILAAEEASFADRARAAHEAWLQDFDAAVLARTVTRWALQLVHKSERDHGRVAHSYALGRQLLRWRFVRRGVVSEFLRVFRRERVEHSRP